jgi:hypothetical protein
MNPHIIQKLIGISTQKGIHEIANFQQYFSYIVAVTFIDGGNQNSQRKTNDSPLFTDNLYHIILYRVHFT